MSEFEHELETRLHSLRDKNLYRTLTYPAGVDFSSNDYLGLSKHASLFENIALNGDSPLSAPASRLLRGNTELHRRLESHLAEFKGTEDALLFSSGYQANLAVLTTLIGPADRVLSDELNHASIIDGLRLLRPRRVIFPHLDAGAVERELQKKHPQGRTFLVTESLFSMDGDIAPLDRYAGLTERYGAELIVDDAHATGLFGNERGSGLTENFGVESRVLAVVSTFGKALGVFGAFVGGSRLVIEYLINKARPFIFTTAQPPFLLKAIANSLNYAESHPELRHRTLALSERFRNKLEELGVDRPGGDGPIVPVVIGDSARTLETARSIQRIGYDVRAIRPPTVPEGTSRLRISVHADHTEAEIDGLADAVAESLRGP